MTHGPAYASDIQELTALVDQFANDREWSKFHSLKNLSMAISIEAAELMEVFQWAETADVAELMLKKRPAVEAEVADVFAYLLRFCSVAKIDLRLALQAKVTLNDQKYPIDRVRGKSAKYDEY